MHTPRVQLIKSLKSKGQMHADLARRCQRGIGPRLQTSLMAPIFSLFFKGTHNTLSLLSSSSSIITLINLCFLKPYTLNSDRCSCHSISRASMFCIFFSCIQSTDALLPSCRPLDRSFSFFVRRDLLCNNVGSVQPYLMGG